MYIDTEAFDNVLGSLVKRDKKLSEVNDQNSTLEITTRVSTIVVILSWYIYGKYAYFCLRGLIRHKNLNFLFPLAATLFAFANNTNDIANYIYHPSGCKLFYLIFMGSATLNWAPISWLQAYRLALIAKIYLSKFTAFIIITLAVILSCIYCTFYFLNLSLFNYTKTDTTGCAVANPGQWTPYIMISDITDSVFSLASICIIVFKSINHLKELNTRNEKLNDLVAQGIVELFVIALAKIIIYPLIHYTSAIPGLDVFWDVLSIIVIISAYNLVNFPYEHSDASKKKRHNLRKNVFKFIDTNIGHMSQSGGSSNNESATRSANRSFKKSYVKIPSSAAKSPNTYNNSKSSEANFNNKNSDNSTFNRSANTMNNESPYSPTYHGIFNYDNYNINNYNDNYIHNFTNNNNNQFFYNK